ncbi:MAG: hypothetical protein AB7P40_10250 [Chloroflexota bacterium]
MLAPGAHRALGLVAVICTLLLTACGTLAPASPTPSEVAKPAGAGRGNGGGGGGGNGRGAQANGEAGQGQGQARGGGGGGNFRGNGGQARASGSPDALSPNLNGEVDIVEGRLITVATNTGWRKVEIPESATIRTEGKGAPTDLTPGTLVGVTGKPDGTAVSIRIFPPGVTPRSGQFPMNGPQAGNIMTNASITAFDGKTLTLDYDGTAATISVPPDTEILKPVPAALTDIVVGSRVQASGTVSGDTLTARTVTILTGERRGRG